MRVSAWPSSLDIGDPSVGGSGRRSEGGLAQDEPVLERALARLRLCVHGEAYRTKLHLGYGMAPIAALRRRGQPGDITRLCRRQHALERDRREMVALVDDDLPVARHEIGDGLLAHQALDHRDVDFAGGVALSGTDLPNLLGVDSQEHGELRAPLVEQRFPVHQDQRAAGTRGHQVRANDGLAEARRRDESAAVARKKRAGLPPRSSSSTPAEAS